jgi:hypothetical protein
MFTQASWLRGKNMSIGFKFFQEVSSILGTTIHEIEHGPITHLYVSIFAIYPKGTI